MDGAFKFDPGRCTVRVKLDDRELREGSIRLAGRQDVPLFVHREACPPATIGSRFELEPLDRRPRSGAHRPRWISGSFRSRSRGRSTPSTGRDARNYDRFFPRDEPPQTDPERREYAREVLAPVRDQGVPSPGR